MKYALPLFTASLLLPLAVLPAGNEPKIPGIMLPELTKVTPEMIAKITVACPGEPLAKPAKPRKLLVFSRCENFTHHSISVAEKALTILGEKTKAWSTDISYDYSVFDAVKLSAYDAILLNNNQSMEFPEGAAREALLSFVRDGKGIISLHSAVDNFGTDDLTALRNMIGGASAGHPWGHYLTWRFKVEEAGHPLTAHLNPEGFSIKDAMYQFDTRTSRKNVRVLVSLDMSDPTTAKDENNKPRGFRTDGLNPVVWVRHEGKGRVFVNGFGNNDEIFWTPSMLKLNLAGIQYALGDLKAEDSIVAGAATNAGDAKSNPEPESPPANVTDAGGLKAAWWNNNSFRGEPVHTSVVTKFNPIVSDAGAPFPKTMSGLGPDFVSARFVGTFTPKVSGEFKFVSNADDYVALWVNGVEEIAWTGHTANDRFSTHSFHLVKNKPLEIRIDFRQDTLGYKLTLRLARQSDGVQIDFGTAVGTFTPASEIKPVISMLTTNLSTTTAPAIETAAVIDWPCFRGANHDGKSTDTGLLKEWPAGGPKKLWQFSGLGTGFSTVSVSGGTLYTSGDVEGQLMLFALDMDGKLKWKITHDRAWEKSYPGSRSTPTVNNERVYLVSGHGLIGCYDAKSGAKVWTRTMQELGGSTPNWGYAESVLIDGSSAIVTPGGAGCITALDKVTGKTLWQSKGFEGGAHYSSCIAFTFEGKRFVAVGTAEGLFCVDAATGEKSFFNPYSARNTANIPSPAFADGYVFWSTGTGKGGICLKLGPNGAEEAWKTSELSSHHGGFIIHEGFIYGNHKNGVACLDLKTGQQKWFDKTPGKGSLTFADGMLYLFAENDGAVTLAPASPNGMKCSGQFSVAGEGPSWAYPVVTGGCLYLRYGTTLYCFDVKTIVTARNS